MTTRYAVVARDGEVYAICDSPGAAELARLAAENYLDGAATCGHPAAPAWVAERLPFEIRAVSDAEVTEILDDGIPILDREP